VTRGARISNGGGKADGFCLSASIIGEGNLASHARAVDGGYKQNLVRGLWIEAVKQVEKRIQLGSRIRKGSLQATKSNDPKTRAERGVEHMLDGQYSTKSSSLKERNNPENELEFRQR